MNRRIKQAGGDSIFCHLICVVSMFSNSTPIQFFRSNAMQLQQQSIDIPIDWIVNLLYYLINYVSFC
ncbi:hypothetical protein L6452_42509 [Arctium lappa]|uniref:Uncharacterized protein n=1 Tax=Arctium lappa TaxID=4217 RepID=A0ACB8XIE7_ARCLA|nr:hypothetical protein L6452_42509 [Arctium lappa]